MSRSPSTTGGLCVEARCLASPWASRRIMVTRLHVSNKSMNNSRRVFPRVSRRRVNRSKGESQRPLHDARRAGGRHGAEQCVGGWPTARTTCSKGRKLAEKRRLLSFLLSNCVWKAGVLAAEYCQLIDMLALAREAGGGDEAMSGTKNGQFENWLPGTDSNSSWCQRNPSGGRAPSTTGYRAWGGAGCGSFSFCQLVGKRDSGFRHSSRPSRFRE